MPTKMRHSEQREKSGFDKGFDAGYKSGREYYFSVYTKTII